MFENEIATKIIGKSIELHTDLKLGLLINFNTKLLKKGIYRVVNNLLKLRKISKSWLLSFRT
jgi:hypothetical protein